MQISQPALMKKQPVLYVQAIQAIAVGVLPVLAAFGAVGWTIEQFGVVEVFVILVSTTFGGLFTNSKVSPHDHE